MGAGISAEKETADQLREIRAQVRRAAAELLEEAALKPGQILVVGCSSSEIASHKIGSYSSEEIGETVFGALMEELEPRGVYLAAQCCEHLNRAIITERAAVPFAEIVNVVPQPKAGGSFATEAYKNFKEPVAVEEIKADAGLDIGQTLIGMHLKKVAVPVRLSVKTIGEAPVTAARTRPKFIGGVRAHYDENKL